ncbi:UNVERIFIED_CONTAM: Ubinuclein-1 [Sesamum latifolium]|uniref:Ubinuclein-1 n=1 Tax=Sesamum latifolium TaxID=2727402 RepID=A0AAW2VR77_9LAMI
MVEGSGGGGPELGPGSKPTSSFEAAGGRLRFTVELRPGETTIVSWKKLLREANSSKSNRPGPSNSGQSFEAQRQPVAQPPAPPPPLAPSSSKQPTEAEPKDSQAQAGSNRLSTVIERIERMYAGNGSSDEEDVVLDNIPDDDEYDTEDSFIDDTELVDDYFQVDNLAVKHDGFFVNRGKLEPMGEEMYIEKCIGPLRASFAIVCYKSIRLLIGFTAYIRNGLKLAVSLVENPMKSLNLTDLEFGLMGNIVFSVSGLPIVIEPTICTDQQPKKRRRKDLMKGHGGSDDGHNPNKFVKVGNRGRKRNSTSQSHGVSMPNIHGEDMQFQASLANASEVSLKKKTTDMQTAVHPSELLNGDAIREDTETDLQIPGDPSSKNHITKWKESEFQDTSTQRSNDKSPHLSKSHNEKQLYTSDNLDQSTQQKEKGGLVERFDLNIPASRDSLPTVRKEGSSVRPKGATLEKAIRELEKIVAESSQYWENTKGCDQSPDEHCWALDAN